MNAHDPRKPLLALLICTLLASGCFESTQNAGGPADELAQTAAAGDGGAAGAGTTSSTTPQGADEVWELADGAESSGVVPEPSEVELTGFVSNTAHWAGMLVRTSAATVLTGHDDAIVASYETLWSLDLDQAPRLDATKTYLRVTWELTNVGRGEVDFTERDTWDLTLADGTRIAPVDRLDVSILAGNTATTRSHYALEPGTDLAGASITLEGEYYDTLEPASIPLDALLVREFPRRLDAWVGTVLEDEHRRVEIDEAMWDDNHELIGRPAVGMRSIWLRIAVTMSATWSEHYNGGDVRISVDGRSSSPVEAEHGIVDELETRVFLVVFAIDADATEAQLLLPLSTGSDLVYGEPMDLDLTTGSLVELPSIQ